MTLSHRLAQPSDLDALRAVMALAIAELQKGFLDDAQIAASHAVMGLDTQLIADGTYFVIEAEGRIAGCGGWSHRATLYGGDHAANLRNPPPLNPAFARQGVGRMVMALCEAAAQQAGFARTELMATLSGEPLYRACGYTPIEHVEAPGPNGASVPLIRMGKRLSS